MMKLKTQTSHGSTSEYKLTNGGFSPHISPDIIDCSTCVAHNPDEFYLNKFGEGEHKNKWFLYILLCEENKRYVGITQQLRYRLFLHFIGRGAKWTMKHKPVAVVRVLSFDKRNTEDKLKDIEDIATLKLMNLYGEENVRGGSWCSRFPLSEKDKRRLKRKRKQHKI